MNLEDLCGLLMKHLQSLESDKAIRLIESNPELTDIALEKPSADKFARCSRPIHRSTATGNEKVLRYYAGSKVHQLASSAGAAYRAQGWRK